MTEPYLILHKVRGQPAFDIAEKMECPKCHGIGCADPTKNDYEGPPCDMCEAEGYWWIVSTSGHRAYPIDASPIGDIEHRPTGWLLPEWMEWTAKNKMPDDLPDHYPINYQEPTVKPEARHRTILQRLGLAKPKGELKRI